jgi:hypothetical protein
MRRKTLDLLLNWVGVLLTAVFLIAGVGLLVGYSFTSSQVKSQLIEQKVFFPLKGQMDYQDLVVANLTSYAGQQVLTGSQAQMSAASLADPKNAALANQVNLVFRGDTLRGLLLNAYAFGFMGIIALYGAIAMLIAALVMLIVTLLGVRHYKQGDPALLI